jgi:DNA-binding GntR family transcriptional regulator
MFLTTTGPDSGYVRPVRSLVEEAAAAVRAAILSGEIPAGARIRIQDLEERLGISRIPIREALRRLEAEGLVKTAPYRATVATPLSLTELRDVYDVREALEIRAAKRSVARLRPQQLEAANEARIEAAAAIREDDRARFFEANHRFHRLLREPGSNATMEHIIQQLLQTADRYTNLALNVAEVAGTAEIQHWRIYEAYVARDWQAVKKETLAHLHITRSTVLEALHSQFPGDEEEAKPRR